MPYHVWGFFHPIQPVLRATGLGYLYEIREPFHFVAAGEIWTCPAGLLINGQSIPRWLWPFTGHPFQQPGFRASVIHDAYCVLQSRSWQETHHVFYPMLRADGVRPIVARVRAAAVWRFGPRW